jgi:predicted acylesterase/phospholipase RssA
MTEALQRLREARRVGYVFSGGSARCAFQVGAIEQLAAAGITPSLCIGVSAGSWNAAIVAARIDRRARYYWKSFFRMPHVSLRAVLTHHSPYRFSEIHRRTFARFIGQRLQAPGALPLFVSVTRLRDGENLLLRANDLPDPVELLLAANYLPPFYTHAPRIDGERYGDGGASDNAPYERAFAEGCDAVVLMTVKGESEGGIYRNPRDVDHLIPAEYRDRVVVIRPRHRLPFRFTERRWQLLDQLVTLGALRMREVLYGEYHPATEIRAAGESPSVKLAKLAAWFGLFGD